MLGLLHQKVHPHPHKLTAAFTSPSQLLVFTCPHSSPSPLSPFLLSGVLPTVPHVRQLSEWDCGLACAVSLLQRFSLPSSYPHLLSSLNTQSIWSIDLLLLLHTAGLDVSLYTTYPGVNPSHATDHYYTPTWDADTPRVTHLFTLAAQLHIPVHRQSLSPSAFLALLSPPTPHLLLVLVNPTLLHCVGCAAHHSTAAMLRGGFTGHFIIVTGVEKRRGVGGVEVEVVRYVDPASDCNECAVGAQWLEQARKAEGTDEDCIVIAGLRPVEPPPPPPLPPQEGVDGAS